MTASIPIFSPMVRVTDANGNPVANGTVEFYNAGTSTPKTVYADKDLTSSLGTTVSTDSGGHTITSGNARTLVYTGTDAFKAIVKDANGSTLVTYDSVPGAVIVPEADTSALAKAPVISETSNRIGTASDRGKLIAFNTTSGALAYTLPSAVAVGDDWLVHLCVGAGTNTLIYRTTGSDTVIQAGGKSVTAAVVSGVVTIVCDGAGFRELSATEANRLPRTPFFTVADRLTATPSSPTAGALYIVTGSPSGAWSTLGFTTGQIAESNGNGSWTARTPAEGWLAHVADEGVLTQYRSGAWTDLPNVTAPNSSTLECATFEDQKANGTAGGTASTGAWTTRTINTTVSNTITGCSLASNQITLAPGTYFLSFWGAMRLTAGQHRIKVISGTATPDAIVAGYQNGAGPDSAGHTPGTHAPPASTSAFMTVTATAVIELQYYAVTALGGTDGLGQASVSDPASLTEVFSRVSILDLAAIQGPQGAQGTQGTDGLDAAYPYQWSTSTSGDPGSGKVAVNNADPTLATVLRVNQTDASGGVLTNVIATWDDSTSNVRARVKISKEGATQNFYAYSITGAATDQGDYWDFPVAFLGPASGTTLSSSDSVALLVIEKGDKGDTGATGASGSTGATGATGATGPNTGHDYAFDTDTADSDQGAGKFWLNHATPGSATWAYISKTDRNGNDLGTEIGGWDDSDNTAHRLTLRVWDVATPTKGFTIEVTGTFTDATTYWKIPISSIAARVSGAPAAAAVLAVMPHRTGNKGADGAGTGDFSSNTATSVDSELVLFSGTGGKTGKRATTTGILKGASGVLSAAAAGTDYVAPGGALGTPSSGTLTNATGLPISTGVSGLGSNVATFLATPSSANLAAALTDETGSGAAVFATSPTLTTPNIGVATATSVNKVTITAPATGATLVLADGKALTVNNTIALQGTDSTVMTFPSSSSTIKAAGKETIFMPAAGMTSRTTNGAASGTTELTTNDVMLATLDFDQTTEEGAGFFIAMPKSWNESTVTFKPFWTAASGSGGVVWGLAAYAFSDDDALDTAVSGQQTSTDTLIATGDMHIGPESSAITIGGTPAEGDVVYFEITREVGNGSDTLSGDAKLIGVHVYITTNAATDA